MFQRDGIGVRENHDHDVLFFLFFYLAAGHGLELLLALSMPRFTLYGNPSLGSDYYTILLYGVWRCLLYTSPSPRD